MQHKIFGIPDMLAPNNDNNSPMLQPMARYLLGMSNLFLNANLQ